MLGLKDYLESPGFGFALKLLTGIAAAGFGLLGVGKDTRDSTGRLNGNGKIALAGILSAAILALGTSIYEFTSERKKDEDSRKSAEHLILSVERGLYPLRGINASFELTFNEDFAGLEDYRKTIVSEITKDPSCASDKKFYCWGQGEKGFYKYHVPSTSSLFPQNGSLLHTVFENLTLTFIMSKRNSAPPGNHFKYEYAGSFYIPLGDHVPDQWGISYNRQTNRLSLYVDEDRLFQNVYASNDAYSLVDFVPGVFAASADNTDDKLCAEVKNHGFSDEECGKKIIAPLSNGLELAEVELKFDYPKSIGIVALRNRECKSGNRKYFFALYTQDIDSDRVLSNDLADLTEDEVKDICASLQPKQNLGTPAYSSASLIYRTTQ